MTSNWVATWTWANGQQVTGWWNAKVMSDGASVAAASETYNGRLNPGQSTSFGFNASWNGTNSAPTVSCTAS
jgi:chitin-binding protein